MLGLLPLAMSLTAPALRAQQSSSERSALGTQDSARSSPASDSAWALGVLDALATKAPVPASTSAGLPAAVGFPQSFGAMMTALQDATMGMIKGCNYEKYLALADSLASVMSTYSDLTQGPPGRRWAVPFVDGISMLFRAAATMTTRRSAAAAQQALAYQLEHTCNAVVQADQATREFQLLKAAGRNIERTVAKLVDEFSLSMVHVPSANTTILQGKWDRLYTAAAPRTRSAPDSLWEAVDTTLNVSLAASEDMHGALDSLSALVRSTEAEMLLLAEPDSADPTRWTCPDGYADPNDPTTKRYGAVPVCGPAAAERQAQAIAHLELLKTQIRMLQVGAESRQMQVEAARLMTDTEGRKVTAANRTQSVLAW